MAPFLGPAASAASTTPAAVAAAAAAAAAVVSPRQTGGRRRFARHPCKVSTYFAEQSKAAAAGALDGHGEADSHDSHALA